MADNGLNLMEMAGMAGKGLKGKNAWKWLAMARNG